MDAFISETEIPKKRKEVQSFRQNLSAEQVALFSKKILVQFQNNFSKIEKDILSTQKSVALYNPMSFEPQLLPLFDFFNERGYRIAFPKITDRAHYRVDFIWMNSLIDENWETGDFGIKEPLVDPSKGQIVVEEDSLSLILVPGVLFGHGGERVGMGKGYYDRLLPRFSSAKRVALAFDFQIFQGIYQSPTDVAVEKLISNDGTII